MVNLLSIRLSIHTCIHSNSFACFSQRTFSYYFKNGGKLERGSLRQMVFGQSPSGVWTLQMLQYDASKVSAVVLFCCLLCFNFSNLQYIQDKVICVILIFCYFERKLSFFMLLILSWQLHTLLCFLHSIVMFKQTSTYSFENLLDSQCFRARPV